MYPTRRELLAGVGAAGLASFAGCAGLGVLTGEEALAFEAESAVVAEAGLSDAGYREYRRYDDTVTRTFEVAGRTRDVEVTNAIAEYDRSVTVLGFRIQGAVFTALSTPNVEVLGKAFNPVAEMSTDDLAETIQTRYENIENVRRESARTVDVLGRRAEVVRYRADGRFTEADLRIGLTLHVAEAVEAGGDFVVCVAAHPRAVDDTDGVDALLRAVEHAG